MPKLIRLYILSIATGFAISAVFLEVMLWLDVAHLRHLVWQTPMGWLAGFMIFASNGIVFAGVQFAIRIMGMAEDEDGPKGGNRAPLTDLTPVPVRAKAR
jgi:hypothetical protein